MKVGAIKENWWIPNNIGDTRLREACLNIWGSFEDLFKEEESTEIEPKVEIETILYRALLEVNTLISAATKIKLIRTIEVGGSSSTTLQILSCYKKELIESSIVRICKFIEQLWNQKQSTNKNLETEQTPIMKLVEIFLSHVNKKRERGISQTIINIVKIWQEKYKGIVLYRNFYSAHLGVFNSPMNKHQEESINAMSEEYLLDAISSIATIVGTFAINLKMEKYRNAIYPNNMFVIDKETIERLSKNTNK